MECRRAFPQFVRMIQAVATLHQFQRQRDSSQRAIATPADYRIAMEFMEGPLGKSLKNELSASVEGLLKFLVETYSNGDFSTTEAAAAYDKGRRSVQDGLHELAQRELVVQVEPSRGPNPAVWTISPKASDPAPGSKFHLPTFREVEEYQLASKA